LEETNLPDDTSILKRWKDNQITLYSDFSKKWRKSNIRIKYLDSTISYLKTYGKVLVVRLPVDREIINVENKYWNSFNKDINAIAKKNNIPYINFNTKQNSFKTYDGVHIDKYSGVEFTKTLCDSIYKYVQ